MISFGPDILEAYRKAGEYVTDILVNGSQPATMRCSEPAQFFTHINTETARGLGIEVPETILGTQVQSI